VLQARRGVIRRLAYGWDRQCLSVNMIVYIIMHNMIVEAERGRMVTNTNFDNIGTQINLVEAMLNVTER
jgi:Holliday junction resolvasome RuvABC ATP-dependent DNA helicase subunit